VQNRTTQQLHQVSYRRPRDGLYAPPVDYRTEVLRRSRLWGNENLLGLSVS